MVHIYFVLFISVFFIYVQMEFDGQRPNYIKRLLSSSVLYIITFIRVNFDLQSICCR